MQRLLKKINSILSLRLSLIITLAMAVLLMASMAVMLYYSRRSVKEEALHKASQTLESTVQRIDNLLLSVEQSTGNIYFSLLNHINEPDMMYTYSRELVETNKYIVGCAIAFKPYFYKDHEKFMAYFHRDRETTSEEAIVLHSDGFLNESYIKQLWFTKPMETGKPGWLNPLEGIEKEDVEHIITFCLPITDTGGQTIGVIGVDVSLKLLSRIVLAAKPSANSYSTLLAGDGTYFVHPDSNKLFHQTVFTQSENGANPSTRHAAEAMISGETGFKSFNMNGTDYYVFYKPFERTAVPGRSMEELKWSAGIIYPEEDIFGDYNSLLYYVLAIAIVGLVLIFLLSKTFIHRQLMPLQMLTDSAQRIAQGRYDERIPSSRQMDEIGRLQDNFQHMQQSLASHIGELEQLTSTLQERDKVLSKAYNQAQKAERMKIAFLHNMTNQMLAPAETIDCDVCQITAKDYQQAGKMVKLADDIQYNGDAIAELLKKFIYMSDAHD